MAPDASKLIKTIGVPHLRDTGTGCSGSKPKLMQVDKKMNRQVKAFYNMCDLPAVSPKVHGLDSKLARSKVTTMQSSNTQTSFLFFL